MEEEALRLSGVNVKIVKLSSYAICGFFAGLALAFRYKQQVMDANPLLKLLNSSEAQIVR